MIFCSESTVSTEVFVIKHTYSFLGPISWHQDSLQQQNIANQYVVHFFCGCFEFSVTISYSHSKVKNLNFFVNSDNWVEPALNGAYTLHYPVKHWPISKNVGSSGNKTGIKTRTHSLRASGGFWLLTPLVPLLLYQPWLGYSSGCAPAGSIPILLTRGQRNNSRENTHFHNSQLLVPGLHVHLIPFLRLYFRYSSNLVLR